MNAHYTLLERAVLQKLLAGDHPVLDALRSQLAASLVRQRAPTGVGFFTDIDVPKHVPGAPTRHSTLRIGDVEAQIQGLEHGAGFLLVVSDGYLDHLEGYSYDEPWPTTVKEFGLIYSSGEVRDIESLGL